MLITETLKYRITANMPEIRNACEHGHLLQPANKIERHPKRHTYIVL